MFRHLLRPSNGIAILAVCTGVVIASVLLQRMHSVASNGTAVEPQAASLPVVDKSTVRFFEAPGFYDAIQRFPRGSGTIATRGVVVPHHLVPDDLIAETLASVAAESVAEIVLIGPNHYEQGEAPVITSRNAWVSPIGVTEPALAHIDALTQQTTYVRRDEVVMEGEHAHASIIPFLQYYFPGVPVVSLALGMKLERDDLFDLAARLAERDGGKTLYVATIDFSHYLLRDEAIARDTETAALLSAKNVDALLSLTSQNMDSPRSMVLLMEVMERLGYPSLVIQKNTNSADYLYNYTGEVTTYFAITFER